MKLVERKKTKSEAGPGSFGDRFSSAEEKLIKDVAEATDRNDHSGSIRLVAEFLGYKQIVKVLDAIKVITDFEGQLPSEIGEYREKMRARVMTLLKKDKPALYTEINDAM